MYTRKSAEISRDLGVTERVVKLQQLRLNHTVTALSAIEDLIGELRAHFRAKDIPIVDPRQFTQRRTSEHVTAESTNVNPTADGVEPPVVGMDVQVSATLLVSQGARF